MTPDQREKARLRQARKSARDLAKRVARAEAHARRLEAAERDAELVAPAAQRAARLEVIVNAWGTRHAVRRLPANSRLSEAQRRAVTRLQADWDELAGGVSTGVSNWLRAPRPGDSLFGPPAHAAILRQITTRERLDAALSALGAFRPITIHVILLGQPMTHYARENMIPVEDASAMLHAACDRLVTFYGEDDRRDGIITAAPDRDEYEI